MLCQKFRRLPRRCSALLCKKLIRCADLRCSVLKKINVMLAQWRLPIFFPFLKCLSHRYTFQILALIRLTGVYRMVLNCNAVGCDPLNRGNWGHPRGLGFLVRRGWRVVVDSRGCCVHIRTVHWRHRRLFHCRVNHRDGSHSA